MRYCESFSTGLAAIASPSEDTAMPERPKPAADQPQTDSAATAIEPPAQPSLPKIVPFTDLARCGEEIWISHEGQLYRLQSTKSGKLILTK